MCKYANISDSYSLCFIYYWSIVDLQCASLCCTATWLRCSDIHILFQHSFPLWFITEFWIQFHVLYIRTLFIPSKCNSLHLAPPNSQSTPSLPASPLATTSLRSVSLSLLCRWSFVPYFRFHIKVISYGVCLSNLLHLVW